MNARRHRVAALALVGLAGLAALSGGCTRPKPVKFNNDMARATLELAAEGKKFKEAVDGFLSPPEGINPSSAALRSARDRCASKLEEIQKKYEKAHWPPKADKEAEELLDKFRAYLDVQQKLVDQMSEIIKIAELVPPPEDRKEQIEALVKKIYERGTTAHSGIKPVQEKFFEAAFLKMDEG
jgi:hypothetical protein